jgi:hypothetical protein
MRQYQRLYLLSTVAIFALLIKCDKSLAQTPNESGFFPETGHWVSGTFFQFYKGVDDPLLVFGNPITEQFTDPTNGMMTQYFQRARLDQVNRSDGAAIEIAPLGSLLYEEGAAVATTPSNSPTCHFFPATGKKVCYAFEQFYQKHKGQIYFGNPVSEMMEVNGQIVQYFERARMEWHAERPFGERVVLSDLGRIYFDARIGSFAILAAVPGEKNLSIPLNLHANVFPSTPVAAANSQQTLFVVVQDQYFNPISDAAVSVSFDLPGGRQDHYRPAPTNNRGFTKLEFNLGPLPINEVIAVNVEVLFQGQNAQAASWFRTWW